MATLSIDLVYQSQLTSIIYAYLSHFLRQHLGSSTTEGFHIGNGSLTQPDKYSADQYKLLQSITENRPSR
jgi:hypothetical protein